MMVRRNLGGGGKRSPEFLKIFFKTLTEQIRLLF